MASDEPAKSNQRDEQHVASTSLSLVHQLQNDQSDAWQRLYMLYAPLVRYWCRRLGVPDQDVADVLQDVFQSVARGIQKFSKTKSEDTFRGWLRTITRNRVIDWRRRSGKEPAAAGGTAAQVRMTNEPFPEFDGEMSEDENQLVNQMYLRALKLIRDHFQPQTWQAFWRVVIDGQSAGDVAADLGMKPGTVRVAKSRVLQRLRLELGEIELENEIPDS